MELSHAVTCKLNMSYLIDPNNKVLHTPVHGDFVAKIRKASRTVICELDVCWLGTTAAEHLKIEHTLLSLFSVARQTEVKFREFGFIRATYSENDSRTFRSFSFFPVVS